MKTSQTHYRKGGCIFSLVKLAILSAIVLAVALYFSLSYVVDYVLKTATSGTGIDAGVSNVTMGISEQKIEVENFYISNPPSFKKCNAIEFKDAVIDADISVGDILAKKLIVLDEIKVVGLKMNIDMKTGSGINVLTTAPVSNLTEIKDLMMKKFGVDQNAQPSQSQTSTSTSSDSGEWRIIIKKMIFDDGTLDGSINAKAIKVALPSFELKNIGVDEGGLTPTQLVAEIVGQLSYVATKNIVKDVVNQGVDAGKEGTTKALDKVKNSLKNIFKSN